MTYREGGGVVRAAEAITRGAVPTIAEAPPRAVRDALLERMAEEVARRNRLTYQQWKDAPRGRPVQVPLPQPVMVAYRDEPLAMPEIQEFQAVTVELPRDPHPEEIRHYAAEVLEDIERSVRTFGVVHSDWGTTLGAKCLVGHIDAHVTGQYDYHPNHRQPLPVHIAAVRATVLGACVASMHDHRGHHHGYPPTYPNAAALLVSFHDTMRLSAHNVQAMMREARDRVLNGGAPIQGAANPRELRYML